MTMTGRLGDGQVRTDCYTPQKRITMNDLEASTDLHVSTVTTNASKLKTYKPKQTCHYIRIPRRYGNQCCHLK